MNTEIRLALARVRARLKALQPLKAKAMQAFKTAEAAGDVEKEERIGQEMDALDAEEQQLVAKLVELGGDPEASL